MPEDSEIFAFYTQADVCEIFGVSRSMFSHHIRRGYIEPPRYQMGTDYYYTNLDMPKLHAYLTEDRKRRQPKSGVLSLHDLCRKLKCSVHRVLRWIKAGTFPEPYYKFRRELTYPIEDWPKLKEAHAKCDYEEKHPAFFRRRDVVKAMGICSAHFEYHRLKGDLPDPSHLRDLEMCYTREEVEIMYDWLKKNTNVKMKERLEL